MEVTRTPLLPRFRNASLRSQTRKSEKNGKKSSLMHKMEQILQTNLQMSMTTPVLEVITKIMREAIRIKT